MPGRTICSDHFAEYMREYRTRSDNKRDRAAFRRGSEERLQSCVKYLREVVAGRCLSGFEIAKLLEKHTLGDSAPELIARRRLIDSMR